MTVDKTRDCLKGGATEQKQGWEGEQSCYFRDLMLDSKFDDVIPNVLFWENDFIPPLS